jgi:PilZ domain
VILVEQRRAKRAECLKAGHIALKNGSEIRCVIRNLSPFGACLQVSSHFGVPEDIFLWILGERVKRPCRIVWRSNRQLGVLFS